MHWLKHAGNFLLRFLKKTVLELVQQSGNVLVSEFISLCMPGCYLIILTCSFITVHVFKGEGAE